MLRQFFQKTALLSVLALPLFSFSQELKLKNTNGGVLSLGARTVASTFNNGQWGDMGTGVGGQFMLQFSDHVNTAWFLDYITTPVSKYANREDLHIGWSVMYYFVPSAADKTPKWQPYVLAGHCFDYSKITDNRNETNFSERWSSAVQSGIGTHYNFTSRFNVNMQAQYMIHIGNEVHPSYENSVVKFTQEGGVNLEGHILISLCVNYKIADLW